MIDINGFQIQNWPDEISGARNREGTESSLTNQCHINGVQIKKRKVTAYPRRALKRCTFVECNALHCNLMHGNKIDCFALLLHQEIYNCVSCIQNSDTTLIMSRFCHRDGAVLPEQSDLSSCFHKRCKK